MKAIEKLEEQARNLDAEQKKRAAELDRLRARLADLENEIDIAIDAEDLDKVTELTADKRDLQTRIDALTMIYKRKAAEGVPRDVAAEAWNAEVPKMQKMIDTLASDLDKSLSDVARKALQLCEAINTAWDLRQRALCVVNDDEPYTNNPGNFKFKSFYGRVGTVRALCEITAFTDAAKAIDANAIKIMDEAMRERTTPFYRPKR